MSINPKPQHRARPTKFPIDIKALSAETMRRYPKVMAALAKND